MSESQPKRDYDREDRTTTAMFNAVFLGGLTAVGLATLYVLVRFVKWAWG